MRGTLLLGALVLAGCASTPQPATNHVSIRVDGMVRAEGLTWLDWPSRVREALEALPGIQKLGLVLTEDRFDIEYDPDRVTVEAMLGAIRGEGYQPAVVPRGEASPLPSSAIDVATLPPSLRVLFDDAERMGRPVLLDVSGPGWAACERMDAVTYPDAAVKAELAGWVCGKVDISAQPDVARALGVEGIPTAVALTAEGRVLGRIEGFVEPTAFLRRLGDLRR